MKSWDWVCKYRAEVKCAETQKTFLDEYALETRDLVDLRSKNSKPKDNLKGEEWKKARASQRAAIDGAIREQRQKWRAICDRQASLTLEMFDEGIMRVQLKDIYDVLNPQATKPAEEVKQEGEVMEGRVLAEAAKVS